jgi:hypothetical protein
VFEWKGLYQITSLKIKEIILLDLLNAGDNLVGRAKGFHRLSISQPGIIARADGG